MSRPAELETELQERTCRSCGRGYEYPVAHSLATRFYCEACMNLSKEVRETFELFQKRVRDLTARLAKLEGKRASAGTGDGRGG